MDRVKCGICGKDCAAKKDGEPRAHGCKAPQTTDTCEACGQLVPLRDDGVLMEHRHATRLASGAWAYGDRPCDGSPVEEQPEAEPAPPAAEADPFTSPAEVTPDDGDIFAEPAVAPPVRKVSDSTGRRDARGRYLVKDPATGEFQRFKNKNIKGFTRVTTFVKAASDSVALSDWGKRNVLIGAAMDPATAAKAWGKTHEDDKAFLNGLVEELSQVAGSKRAANRGTDLHAWAEHVDGGGKLEDVPPVYRNLIEQYQQALAEAGFVPVAGLIERTTMVQEFGGIVGTFDRVLFHEPSGTYVIADQKSGKTLNYGMDEIQAQEAIYARGVNQNGVYVWPEPGEAPETGYWTRPNEDPYEQDEPRRITVREDIGLIIHTPAEGEEAGRVRLVKADLVAGWEYAQECHSTRVRRSKKPVIEDWDWAPAVDVEAEEQAWGVSPEELGAALDVSPASALNAIARAVTTKAEAAAMYDQAVAAGVSGDVLDELVAIAMHRLANPSVSTA